GCLPAGVIAPGSSGAVAQAAAELPWGQGLSRGGEYELARLSGDPMDQPIEYDEARETMASALDRAIKAHESQRLGAIEYGYEAIDAALAGNFDPRFQKLHIALQFWVSWLDSRNHQWQYYEPLTEQDWPVYARQIVLALREDRDIPSELILAVWPPREAG